MMAHLLSFIMGLLGWNDYESSFMGSGIEGGGDDILSELWEGFFFSGLVGF